jgi:hypothetical protein
MMWSRVPRNARWALALWMLLGLVVFNVTFDWQVRMAGYAFVGSQVARHQQGQPTLTITEAFRPMVRRAAIDSSMWLALIVIAGSGMTLAAAKTAK